MKENMVLSILSGLPGKLELVELNSKCCSSPPNSTLCHSNASHCSLENFTLMYTHLRPQLYYLRSLNRRQHVYLLLGHSKHLLK